MKSPKFATYSEDEKRTTRFEAALKSEIFAPRKSQGKAESE